MSSPLNDQTRPAPSKGDLAKGVGGLRRRLFLSHLTITFLGVLMLAVALRTSWELRENLLRLGQNDLPAVRAANQLLRGIERSSAALRGWVYLGDPQFLQQRESAWMGEINPAVKGLEDLFDAPGVLIYEENWEQIVASLKELKEKENQLMAVAQNPENEPAKLILRTKISPLATEIFQAISNIIEKRQKEVEVTVIGGKDLEVLLGWMNDFQGHFSFSQKYVGQFIDSGYTRDRLQFSKSFEIARESLAKTRTKKALFTPSQAEQFARIETNIVAYERAVNQAIAIRKSPQWNVARETMTAEIVPLNKKISDLIADLLQRQERSMMQTTRETLRVSHLSLVLLIGLMAAMVVGSLYYAYHISRRMTRPIEALVYAATEMGAGRFTGDLPVSGPRELMQLTSAFNQMQVSVRSEIEMKKRLEELIRSNNELGQFASVASHDLQEPLRTIGSFAELIARRNQGRLEADSERHLALIRDAAQRLQQMIRALLEYSRVGAKPGKFEWVDLEEVIEQVLFDLQISLHESHAQVTHDPLPRVVADPAQLSLLVQNLISNAVKFRGDNPPKIHLSARRDGANWVISVKDNGIGLESIYYERIFQIFQRLHSREQYAGTGIGLAICKRIVERHGGAIWLESSPGQGSTFFFSIPVQGIRPAFESAEAESSTG